MSMFTRKNNYNDGERYTPSLPMAAPNEPHLAAVLLLDTSSSMEGDRIYSLNKGVNDFITKTSLDELAQKRVDIAVIEFNSEIGVLQEFTPVCMMEPFVMTAGGCTSMGAGINKAIDLVKERNHLYDNAGTPHFKPWIFMITDGMPTDDMASAIERIHIEEERGRLKFWSLGVPGYDRATLQTLSKRCIALEDAEFSGIFNWLSESMAIISASQPGENPQLPDLPLDARIIPEDW